VAVTFVGAGTASSPTTGTAAPAWHASAQADDIGLIITSTQTNLPADFSTAGFAQVTTATNSSVDITAVTLSWKRHDGSESTPTSDTSFANGTTSQMFVFRGCIASGDPWSAFSIVSNDTQATTGTASTITPGATDLVVSIGGWVSHNGASSTSSISGTDPTFGTITQTNDTNGTNWHGVYGADGTTSGAATGSRTITFAVSATSVNILIALKVAGGGGGSTIVNRESTRRGTARGVLRGV
jgi:hypothetical protein